MSQQDPFYDVVIVHEKGPDPVSLPEGTQVIPKRLLSPTIQAELTEHGYEVMREIVRAEVQKAIVEMVHKIRAQSGMKF